ncbi:MAG: alpha/beta hydrolase [Chloroflexota bacterium]|nr:MAG: alpha/beta hydrolase [Chloroflexota bacterium]
MTIPVMAGISARTITTSRLTTRVLFSGPADGMPVLFIHGNSSSATWWEETMIALPPGYRGIAHDQRGFGEADPTAKIDATQGTGDLAADAAALLDTLGIARAHLVGNSLGGVVVWRMMMECPERILTVTQVDPGSPYGFGGTKGVEGTPCFADFAGTGAGLVNPELIRLMAAGDRSTDSRFSPRSAIRALIVKPPFVPAREEELLSSMLATHLGEQDLPGDSVPSPNWPFTAPGRWGSANALSPKYVAHPARLYSINPKPPVLWVQGSHDLLVSNTAASDVGTLGQMGVLPGWPGAEVFPPQPMLDQTRAVLTQYAAAGGSYTEVVIQDAGHVPFIEKPAEFNRHFHAHLNAARS